MKNQVAERDNPANNWRFGERLDPTLFFTQHRYKDSTTAMHNLQSSNQRPPGKTRLIQRIQRTEPSQSRFAERMTWTSDIHPPEPEDDRNVDWADFLEHSRLGHDAAACSLCISN